MRDVSVGLSNVEMPSLNSTLLLTIVACSKLMRPFALNTKHVLPCNTSEKAR